LSFLPNSIIIRPSMPKLDNYLQSVDFQDKNFIGTVTFKSEEIALPDGSKIALGIDDGHWVLVYQKGSGASFKVYRYNQLENRIHVDQRPGGEKDMGEFKSHVNYFLRNAQVEDLVTLIPVR